MRLNYILEKKVSHVLCCMGRTHGYRDGKNIQQLIIYNLMMF